MVADRVSVRPATATPTASPGVPGRSTVSTSEPSCQAASTTGVRRVVPVTNELASWSKARSTRRSNDGVERAGADEHGILLEDDDG